MSPQRGSVVALVLAGLVAAACGGGGPVHRSGHSQGPPASSGPVSSGATPSAGTSATPSVPPRVLPMGVTSSVGTDPYPFGVTVAFDRVWVTAHDGYSVDVVDPVTDQVTRTVGVNVQPGSVVAGGGSIWVQSRTDATLIRIDPTTYATTTIQLAPGGSMTCTIAFDHGLVWAAVANDAGTHSTIFEVRPSSGHVAARVGVAGFPCGWASLGTGEWTSVAGKLVRLVPGEAAAHLVRVPELQGADPLLVGAVGGQLYLDGSDGSLGSRLYRARASGAITGSLHRPTDQLLPLVVDDSGLWFSSNGTDMVLVADPRSMRITGTGILTTGEVVPDPTMSLDELWLPDADATAVVKIDPAEFLRRVG